MWVLALAKAHADPLTLGPALEQLVGPCLDDPSCGPQWELQISEALLETTYGLVHEPVMTSAMGGRGMGLATEVSVGTLPIGPKNPVQAMYPSVPVVPSLAVGWHLGSYTYETLYPQVAIGLHGLPPIRFDGVGTWSLGATASVAWPLSRLLWLGVEGVWNTSVLEVPIVQTLATGTNLVVCSTDACGDRLLQHAPSARFGFSLEPMPALFLYGKGALTVALQDIDLVDGTTWSLAPLMPELVGGGGVRLGDRVQVSVGATAASRPPYATTGSPWMTRVVATTGVRFGNARYHEGAQE